ncbi:1417_t:CDS:2 [Ambispora gerdemannii]|uniref:1417_t:CDS:1 n=1 Tax=Ambispora gerdemannii TaxID=144530 RepID=A0A9N9A2B2_9GLOM|nr:1417_t:CDS:2 [Ambispora gerdemannii]
MMYKSSELNPIPPSPLPLNDPQGFLFPTVPMPSTTPITPPPPLCPTLDPRRDFDDVCVR